MAPNYPHFVFLPFCGSPPTLNSPDLCDNDIVDNDGVWLPRVGHPRHHNHNPNPLLDHLLSQKPTSMSSAALWRAPRGKELRPPATSHVSEPAWILWSQSSLQMTDILADILTTTSWKILSPNHPAKPFWNPWVLNCEIMFVVLSC